MAIAYNSYSSCSHIFRATNGGTVFSANLATTGDFDYFTDTAQVNDAIYFSSNSTYRAISDLKLNVGTALSGTGVTIVWEYYSLVGSTWRPIYNLVDNTNGFTTTGANTVQFPLQPNHTVITINGQANRCWIRARISAITSISEGGANSTTTPTIGDGAITLSDYTDASPCTFNDIYNWVIANRPDIEATKGSAGLFKFNNATLIVPSGCTLRSTNEQIYFGNGCMTNANLQGIWFGEKVGTDGWKNQTSLYISLRSPGTKLTSSTGSTLRMYGGTMGNFTNIVDGQTCGYSGYLGMAHGEWIGVYQESSGYFASAVCDRCTVDGSLITSSVITSYPTNQQIADPTLRIWRHYGRTQDITTVKWSLPTTSLMDWAQHNANQGFDLNYTDCDPVFPNQTDAVKVCSRALGTATDINKVWFYDDSAGTYTDYTAQANNDTADDVPVSGDVGDIIYISPIATTSKVNFLALDFTISAQSNDYEYEWEYYGSGGWITLDSSFRFDGTKNLTQSGTFYPTIDGSAGTNPQSAVTINGISGFWTRVRITKKGTGSPTISRIRYRIQQGIYTGYIYEKYSYNLVIKDTDLNPISGASVKIIDNLGNTVFNDKTNGSGNIAQQKLIRKRTEFNAEKSTETDFNWYDVYHSPYNIEARKYGYTMLNMVKAVEGKSSEVGKMMVNSFITADEATASAYTGIDIDHTTNTITIDEDHTMQELYDYSQYDAQENIEYDAAYVTADGNTFFSNYDLILDGCKLSGNATISMVVNSVSYLNDATSEVTIIADDGTHTNIKLTNIVDGSRIQLYDIDSDTELFNNTNGTELIFPIVWTEDRDIRVRVSYVNGVTAKKWYETTATLTSSGINLRIDQEDDTVYNEIAIDGSTVTECSIDGTNLIIDIDDDDAHTSGQRIYAFEVYWLSTEDGIRDQSLYIEAIDSTRFMFEGGLKIKNISDTPLTIDNCNIYPVEGLASDVFDLTGNTIFLNSKIVVPFAYNVNGATEEQFNTLISKTRVLDKKVDDTQSRVITFTE